MENDKNKAKEEQMLKELYLEYIRDGMSPTEAMAKAKRTLACFKGGG